MGITRNDLFNKQQNELSSLFKVLGHPARIAILEHLLHAKACINSDLVEELGLAQATISQHLKELKNIELIQGNIEGKSMNYCINDAKWHETQQKVEDFFKQYNNQQKQCC